jgi:ribulose-phosphate 3-epimerase
MATIAPCVTPKTAQQFDQQMKQLEPFARRIHIDFMDGQLAPVTSPGLEQAWWPKHVKADLHLMYEHPTRHMRALVKLKPHLVIVHAEAKGNFVVFAQILHKLGIKVGVALLPETPASAIKPALEHIDHVMIFSGDLGHYGGTADLELLIKAQAVKHLKPSLEIGWDGGINESNIHLLAAGGVDVLNVGGFIQKASKPSDAYATLKSKLR